MLKNLKEITSNKILISSAGLSVITILVKLLGYAEKKVLAEYFGTSYQVDVYTLVLTIVLSIFFFFREIIEPGFLNVFLNAKSRGEETVAWNLFNKSLRLIFFVTIIISIVSIIYPTLFSNIFAPGFEGERLKLSITLIRIAVPACIFLSLSTLTSITLNGLKIFVLPASGELAFKGLIILCMVFFYKEYGIVGAGVGIVFGSVGRLGIHLFKLYDRISFKKVNIENKYKRRVWQLTWPLLFGVSFSQISSLVDNAFASYLQEGAIAALSYAKKVVELPVVIFPYVISVVIFPYFTQLAIEKQKDKLRTLLADSLKWMIIAFLPLAAFFVIHSTTIIEIVYQGGAFDANSTILTSKPFMIYSFGLVFFAIETVLVIFYYANADTKTPVFVGMSCVVLNIALTWLFIQSMGYIGIALAFVIQKTVKNLLLLYLIKDKISYSGNKIVTFILKLTVSITVFAVFVLICKSILYNEGNQSRLVKMGFLALSFTLSGILYMGILYVFNVAKVEKRE